jgi:hypothetical protein
MTWTARVAVPLVLVIGLAGGCRTAPTSREGKDELIRRATTALVEWNSDIPGLEGLARQGYGCRPAGFCKLIADRASAAILGCHVVGERAVEIVQVVAIAMAGGLRVKDLARVPLSFPTYAGIVGRVAYRAAGQLDREPGGQGHQVEP